MPRLVFAVLGLFLCNSSGEAQDFPNLPSGSPGTGVDAQGDPLPHGARARLGSTRFRVGGTVTAAALSLDGKWIVSGNNSDVLTLSDPKTGKEISRLRIPGGYGASSLTFSPDSRNIAVMGYAPFLQIVAIPSGKLVSKLQVPQPNNSRLTGFAFSGDGKIIVAGTDNFGQNKNFVHAWEVATGKPLHNFEVVQNAQIRGALSNNGAVLATSGYYNPRTGMENNPDQGRTIQLWDVHTGAELRKVKIDNNPIMAVALSQDGKTFAVASGSATFHLFETESGKELRRFAGRRGHIQFLQFAPDGKTLVAGSADGTVQRWEADTGKRLGLTEGSRLRLFGIAFPSPGQVWALGLDGQALALWDAVTDRQLSPGDGHMTWVRFLAYAADGKTLLTGGADGKICWWDTATARELRHHFIRDEDSYRYGGYPPAARFSNYALSRDGKYLAVASDYGQNTIRLFDMANGKVLCDFDAARTGSPSAFAFSPDNTRLAAMGLKGVHLWDVTTGQELTSLPFKADPGNNGSAGGSLVFSSDGTILAGARSHFERTTGTSIGGVYLWNISKGTEIARIEGSGYHSGSIAFSPHGHTLALPMQNQSAMLVKAATGRELGRLEGSQANAIQGLVFSPDGRLLAGAQQENHVYSPFKDGRPAPTPGNRIFLWELASGQVRQEFTGHQGPISCLVFSPDGLTLASGSADTTVVLWDISGKHSGKLHPLAPATIDTAWKDLAEKNGKRAYQDLMIGMIGAPRIALEILRKNLRPAPAVNADPEEIERLIADLDNERFAVRVKAASALELLGDVAGPALQKARLSRNSLEAQRRLKIILEHLDKATLPAEEIRLVRAVEILERIGTSEARAFLRELAGGAPQHRLTVEAQAALTRLQTINNP